MPASRTPVLASSPRTCARALARLATEQHAPHMLKRGGPAQRAANLVGRGADISTASRIAAAQGKGHVVELAQSAHFTADPAALGRRLRARPNRKANDPRVDVEVVRRRKRKHGAQVKVGSAAYVRRAVRAGRYEHLIVNAEAFGALDPASGVTDHLDHAGIAAPQVTATESEATAVMVLERMLLDEPSVTRIDALLHAARAAAEDGLVSFVLGLADRVAHAMYRDIELDVRGAINDALGGAARAAARTGLETYILAERFIAKARAAFSSRLLQRIAQSRLAISAIAEVAVETAIDFVDVLRDRMSFEDLLRRFGVHVATAAGGALGFAAGLALTRNARSWVSWIAALACAYIGSRVGRALGESVFTAGRAGLPAPAAHGWTPQ